MTACAPHGPLGMKYRAGTRYKHTVQTLRWSRRRCQSPNPLETGQHGFILLYVKICLNIKSLETVQQWIKTQIVKVRMTLTSQAWAGAASKRSSRRSIMLLFSEYVSLSQLRPYMQHVIRRNLQHMSYSHAYCVWHPVDVRWCSFYRHMYTVHVSLTRICFIGGFS